MHPWCQLIPEGSRCYQQRQEVPGPEQNVRVVTAALERLREAESVLRARSAATDDMRAELIAVLTTLRDELTLMRDLADAALHALGVP